MDRDVFLARLRRRVDLGFPPNAAHPLGRVDDVPKIDYREPLDDLVDAFVAAVRRQGGEPHRVASMAALENVLDEVLAGAEAVAVSGDPEVALVADLLDDRPTEVVRPTGANDLADVAVGITGAAGAIARTGTVVVASSRAASRTVSLIPPIHLALVPAGSIVATPSDWWRHMGARHPDGPPSQLVFITGPSKSADIELTLTVGVHGPKRLVVAVWEG